MRPQPQPRRILVRGVNWLGDAVMTTPALLRLRERFPEAHITLLTAEKLGDLWKSHPAINEVVVFSPAEGLLLVSRRLGPGAYDLALILPNSPRSALELWLARIPRRIGYARPWRNWLLTGRVLPRSGVVRMRKRSIGEIRERTSAAIPPPASPNSYPSTAHQLHEYLQLVAGLSPHGLDLFQVVYVEGGQGVAVFGGVV